MVKKNNDSLTTQVETRLEELFGMSDEIPPEQETDDVNGNNSLKDLKTLLLSIDWEITDELMTAFIAKINNLKEKYKGDQIISWFLELLDALGKHLKIHKNKAHPDTMKVLNSVYKGLEIVSGPKTRSEAERKKILMIEVEKFKKFKDQVTFGKAGADKISDTKTARRKITGSEKKPEDEMIQKIKRSPEEIIIHTLSEIKDLIRAEFKALREELKLGKETRL